MVTRDLDARPQVTRVLPRVVQIGGVFVRSAQSRDRVLRTIDRGLRAGNAPTLHTMDIDAALILFSFASFVVLFVAWITAPRRAAAPTSLPVVEVGEMPSTAIAA